MFTLYLNTAEGHGWQLNGNNSNTDWSVKQRNTLAINYTIRLWMQMEFVENDWFLVSVCEKDKKRM